MPGLYLLRVELGVFGIPPAWAWDPKQQGGGSLGRERPVKGRGMKGGEGVSEGDEREFEWDSENLSGISKV